MLLGAVMFAVGLVAMVALGTPVVLMIARPKSWTDPKIGRYGTEADDTIYRSFEPMVMEPNPMLWPSEVEQSHVWRKEPPWPSELWDDDFFSGHRVQDSRAAAADTAAHAAFFAQSQATLQPQLAETGRPADADRPQLAKAKRSKQKTPKPKPRATRPTELPGRAEIEQLVASIGLAGTVQVIMDRTGWDFRKAAHFLAKVRKGD